MHPLASKAPRRGCPATCFSLRGPQALPASPPLRESAVPAASHPPPPPPAASWNIQAALPRDLGTCCCPCLGLCFPDTFKAHSPRVRSLLRCRLFSGAFLDPESQTVALPPPPPPAPVPHLRAPNLLSLLTVPGAPRQLAHYAVTLLSFAQPPLLEHELHKARYFDYMLSGKKCVLQTQKTSACIC